MAFPRCCSNSEYHEHGWGVFFFFIGAIVFFSLVGIGLAQVFLPPSQSYPQPVVMGDVSLMNPRAFGTCVHSISAMRWNADLATANRICCHNRLWAEYSGYFHDVGPFMEATRQGKTIQFYDVVTGKHLFTAPVGRGMANFVEESSAHGWPSFNDQEVNWTNVRVLPGGETVSVDGTHLGHLFVEPNGNRFCIDLVCIAGSNSIKL